MNITVHIQVEWVHNIIPYLKTPNKILSLITYFLTFEKLNDRKWYQQVKYYGLTSVQITKVDAQETFIVHCEIIYILYLGLVALYME